MKHFWEMEQSGVGGGVAPLHKLIRLKHSLPKSLLIKVKAESEKLKLNVLICGLKVRIQKIISWHLVPSLHGK